MIISIITLFPDFFREVFSVSIIKRAQEQKKLIINLIDLREFGIGKHRQVDDRPYGGGAGMILRVDVLTAAIEAAKKKATGKSFVILLDPKGDKYTQRTAEKLSLLNHIILICGHYEGVDERIKEFIDSEVSIGDYVLTGGEPAAIVVVDSLARLIPGVLKKIESTAFESFSQIDGKRLLEFPQYTRPSVFRGKKVPEVLLSGNVAEIEKFRLKEAKKTTQTKRPDLV